MDNEKLFDKIIDFFYDANFRNVYTELPKNLKDTENVYNVLKELLKLNYLEADNLKEDSSFINNSYRITSYGENYYLKKDQSSRSKITNWFMGFILIFITADFTVDTIDMYNNRKNDHVAHVEQLHDIHLPKHYIAVDTIIDRK